MIDYKKLLTSFVLGIVFWISGLIAQKFFSSYYNIIILTAIPIAIGFLFSLIMRVSSQRNQIIYSAMSVIVRDIILVIQTASLFVGDESFVSYLKEMFVSFLYVSPIQLILITITWFLFSFVIKRKEKSKGLRGRS